MKLPSGPGAPAADAAAAFAQATAACSGIRTLTAEVAASGKASGQRFRARLTVGVAAPASVRIEAVAPFGPPAFILAADNDDATLLLPRDDRILQHGRSAEVLDAVTGVPLGAADLRAVLTGCGPAVTTPEGRELGPDWRVLNDRSSGYTFYLHRASTTGPWQLLVLLRDVWRAEFRERQNGLPRSLRIASVAAAGAGATFDVSLALSQVEINVPLGAEVFRVDVPRTARPITVRELQDARTGVRKN